MEDNIWFRFHTIWNPHAWFRLLSFISSHLSVCLFCLFSKHEFFWSFSIDYNNNFSFWVNGLVRLNWTEKKCDLFYLPDICSGKAFEWLQIFGLCFFRCYFLYWTWTRKHDWLIALSSGAMGVVYTRFCLRFIHFHFHSALLSHGPMGSTGKKSHAHTDTNMSSLRAENRNRRENENKNKKTREIDTDD